MYMSEPGAKQPARGQIRRVDLMRAQFDVAVGVLYGSGVIKSQGKRDLNVSVLREKNRV